MILMRGRILLGKGFFPLLVSSLLEVLCLGGCAENSSILDNGQSRQLKFSVKTCNWNSPNSCTSYSKSNSRATPITGTTFDTSNSFNVIADVNKGGSWSTEVDNETASYSTANNIWQAPATHYWPGSGCTISFYAYYPTSISGSITHTTGSVPVLSYTVPDNAAAQIDILTSSKTSVAGDSYTQIPVDFKHIFAAIQFSIGSSGLPNGTITKVTLNNIQYKGTYSLDGTWTQNTTDKKCFSQTVSVPASAGTAITSGTTAFMMMPQTLSGDASITVTYSNGGTLTKPITGTWEAGKVYTYNLSKTIPVANFDYTGDVQSYTIPLTGTYKLEVWGAAGGGYVVTAHTQESSGGPGGYSSGTIHLSSAQILYVYVGGAGIYGLLQTGGWNGGGATSTAPNGCSAGSGGGATDIRTVGGDYLNSTSLNSRLIVAGGGGGADDGGNGTYNGTNDGSGGAGGGMSGQGMWTDGVYNSSYGGTQTSGYALGQGQSATTVADAPGAGGGYYGGLVGNASTNEGAGGGSGYIGGVSSGTTIAGNNNIPSHSGSGTTVGNSGNGYARITFVSAN